jgi:5-methylcytosine-specific restriction enzyme A
MPTRPRSHAERLRRRRGDDRAYDQQRRRTDPGLWHAKHIRSSARWQHLRDLVLSRQPLCADPYGTHAAAGAVVPATQVDHIESLTLKPELAFVLSNVQALCTACHGRKSGTERRREGEGGVNR